jgi:hypothetical protein
MPFLTDLDSRAAIKGSRDPLGLVPLWSRFGRHVVGNLTTVSSSVRGFTTLLLGYYFAEAVHAVDGAEKQSTLNLFITFEQMAGFVRLHVNNDDGFRGRDRVVLRLGKGTKVSLGPDQADQILADQKIYGLWGLFSDPARSSGLLSRDERLLTRVARDFVETHYISALRRGSLKGDRHIVDLLRRERKEIHLEGRDAEVAQRLAGILTPTIAPVERAFYDHHLTNGGDEDATGGRQPLLADLLSMLPADTEFDMSELRDTTKRASKHPAGQELAHHLTSIDTLERLLVPMASAFGFLLTRDGQAPGSVAHEVSRAWGALQYLEAEAIGSLRPDIAVAFGGDEPAERIVDMARAFVAGNYEDVIRLLLAHNAYVMEKRNGSQPWIRIDNAKLDVRYRDESGMLIDKSLLPHTWRNTYFINSLKSIETTLRVT